MSIRTISELIPDQLPGFVRDEAPLFEAFIKAYYEFAEQENESIGAMRHLERNFDIDEASLEFVEYFRREVIEDIPADALADPRLLVKNIRQLYKAKGSQNAYKFLFRLLYDADVEFFYPGEKILRASDGRFSTQTTLRLQLTQGSASALGGETIIGLTNGGRAIVEDFVATTELGVSVITARLSGVSGTFENDEPFTTVDGSIQGVVFARIGGVATFNVEDGGGQHQVGDEIAISGAGGIGARATVSAVNDQSAVQFEVINGGSGYRPNVIYSTTESSGFFIPAITGGSGQGASFRVVSITDTQPLQLNKDLIVELQNVQIGADPFSGGPEGANITPILAASNADSVLQDALTFDTSGTIGTIDEIEVINPGFGYSTLPNVTVVDYVIQEFLGDNFPDDTGAGGFKGSNAVIAARHMPGAITSLNITVPGSSYDRQLSATISNLDSANTFNGSGFPNPTALSDIEGVYVDTNRGILGGDNVLQDNFYYQEYSYVLRTPINTSVYRAVIDKLLHPSGTKLFSEVQIRAEIPFSFSVESEYEINLEQELDVTPLFTNIQVEDAVVIIRKPVVIGPVDFSPAPLVEDAYITFAISDVGDITSTAIVSTDGELQLSIEEVGAIASTASVSEDDLIMLGLVIRKEVGQEILPTVIFGTTELQLSIEDVVEIASTAIVSTDGELQLSIEEVGAIASTAIVSTNGELQLFIEDVNIPTSTLVSTDNELQLSIEEVGAIASTAIVSTGDTVGFPTQPELVLFIEKDQGIASTALLGGYNEIAPFADVELNSSPFSSDPDIGSPITSDLAGADINTTLNDALNLIEVSHT